MEYLYKREAQLRKEIRKLEKDCFDPKVKSYLAELRARHNEISKAITALEHEI